MATETVHATKDGLTLRIPDEFVEKLALKDGSKLEISIDGASLAVRPAKPRFTLGQLLKEHAEIMHELPEDRDWIDAPRVGRELI
jgi:antitoxin ChpS